MGGTMGKLQYDGHYHGMGLRDWANGLMQKPWNPWELKRMPYNIANSDTELGS